VMAHFVAGDDATALSLIRLQWGYMLSSPNGTGSTFWEGYLQDGSFDYDPPFMSLAHGWATGPTSALTNYVAGIGPELSSTVPFYVIPHPGDLTQVSATVYLLEVFPEWQLISRDHHSTGERSRTVWYPHGREADHYFDRWAAGVEHLSWGSGRLFRHDLWECLSGGKLRLPKQRCRKSYGESECLS
jgi:hypothetical protein